MMRSLLRGIAVCGVVVACDREILGPDRTLDPGPLDLQMVTPSANDGAALLTISGGPIDSVTSSRFEVSAFQVSADTYRVLVRGPIHTGSVFRVWVPDRAALSAYAGVVEQVVDARTYTRRPVSGYAAIVQLATDPPIPARIR
jgi:hypothetical protein